MHVVARWCQRTGWGSVCIHMMIPLCRTLVNIHDVIETSIFIIMSGIT